MQLYDLFLFFVGFIAALIVMHSFRSIAYGVAAFFTMLIALNLFGVSLI